MTLREQIEALPTGIPRITDDRGDLQEAWQQGWEACRAAVLDVIDAHRCIPDRDALAAALHDARVGCVRNNSPAMRAPLWCVAHHDRQADAIIAELEKP